jgi:malonate decarboxylase delta subunit
VILEPSNGQEAHVTVRTSIDGYDMIWKSVLDRFFDRNNVAAAIEINDFGATPGVVMLRLQQALRESRT